MNKIWMEARLDKLNSNGVDFKPANTHTAHSIDEIVQLIESSEVADLQEYSFGKQLGLATDGVPESDRLTAIFLVNLATAIQKQSFNHDKRPWKTEGIGKLVTCFGTELALSSEHCPYVDQIKENIQNPLFKFRIALISFDETDKAKLLQNVRSLYSASIEGARHLLRFSGYLARQSAIATLEVAAYLASKYPGAIEDIEDVLCTIRYAFYQDASSTVIKCGLAELLLHFVDHPRWGGVTVANATTEITIVEIRKEWVNAAFHKDVFKLENLRDILMPLFKAVGREELADDVWSRSAEILKAFADNNPGGIADGVVERLLYDGKSRLTAEERKELIKTKRASIQAIVNSMKPIYGPLEREQELENIVSAVLFEPTLNEKLLHLFKVPVVVDGAEAKEILQARSAMFPLQSTLGVKKTVGDRDDGGTDVDPDFRVKELQMELVTRFMAQIALPVIEKVVADNESALKIIQGSYGWSECFSEQCKRSLGGFATKDAMQCLYYGISFLEGFLGRALDMAGVSVDREKSGGYVTQRSMLNTLLDELPRLGFNSREVEVFKLMLCEGGAGWNFRNLAYHGLAADERFDIVKATALLYVLLKLAFVFRDPNSGSNEV